MTVKPIEPPRTGDTALFAGIPSGSEALALARLAGQSADVLFIARDDMVLARTASSLAFFSPDITCLEFPAWDCLPYDRVSPLGAIVGQRLHCLGELGGEPKGGRIVLATVSGVLQRIPPQSLVESTRHQLKIGAHIDPTALSRTLEQAGYRRAETVMEQGEFAVRGGIFDIFPPAAPTPLRLDFFGDELDTIRRFDPTTQRTLSDGHKAPDEITLGPVSEILLTDDAISRFRSGYRAQFGVSGADDPLYEAVSAGERLIGMEHWLPLFHENLVTLFDYLPGATVVLDHETEQALEARHDLIAEYFQARLDVSGAEGAGDDSTIYRPVPPDTLFMAEADWTATLAERPVVQLSPFAAPADQPGTIDLGGHKGRDFADVRVQPDANVYDAVRTHTSDEIKAGRRVLIAAFTEGSRDRLSGLLVEHGVEGLATIEDGQHLDGLPEKAIGIAVLPLEAGYADTGLAVISEQDILGDRLTRPGRRRLKAENFIAEVSSLNAGDLVVHMDHGIARFDGLQTIEVTGAPHDCLRLIYAGDDKLFVPVENIEVLSRYGSEDAGVQLDRLGGAAWQARRAKLKERVREMAGELIRIAAARSLKKSEPIPVPPGVFDEFCARFPFNETEDQQRAISDVLEDLANGRPTDRLICGDVGFGKTEVALRAAFAVAYGGKQVAIVAPTTLLCRQHFNVFTERFKGFPMRVAQLSRLVTAKQSKETKEALEQGQVDIVIGTHALLAKDVKFRDLGMLVVDEEQHFGVAHKERLKKFRSGVHVLTLSATPIPRTLQQALTGIRDMSLIATPPVDRLAVRTFVLPFDPVVIREALMREKFRGGQSFYVCPRIADIARVEQRLRELVPDLRLGVAHGQMPIKDLEDTISAFYEGKFDVLLSTNIVESGLDLPSVNTIIIHRADMFGLAQLYQLRGRVGRSKIRAYAYLTLPPKQKITAAAQRRLEVMQTLDSLGAGFSLASHDLDIRGAGNLLGDEQSGHIREVGVELYQQMLEEAVAEARGLEDGHAGDAEWSPQISLGLEVLIPDHYVADLSVRMNLYRRLASLTTREEIDAFAAELIDRFGPLPDAAENLLQVVALKALCRQAGVDKVDAGPKGAVIGFRNDYFANPAGLVGWLTTHQGTAKLRPDHKLVFMRKWDTPHDRLEGARYLVGELVKVANEAAA
jgi:transcription-repair coupling factor (superfamily II helicase)